MSYSSNVVPASTWHALIPTPDDGDGVLIADEAEVIQFLADRSEILKDTLFPGKLWQPLVAHTNNGVGEWAGDMLSFLAYESQTVNANEFLRLDLPKIQHGATLTEWTIAISGPGGYAGAPAVKNRAYLYYMDMTLGTTTQVGSTGTDPATFGGSPDFTDYREITVSGLSHVIDLTSRIYLFSIEHESGANAQVGVYVYGASLTMTNPT